MPVDATDVPASSTRAIVATLGLVALLSFLLRVYARGKGVRSRGCDDWVLLVAVVCAVGVEVGVGLSVGKEVWPAKADGEKKLILLWVVTLLHVLGIGFVKLSVPLSVLRLELRNWHRHTVVVYICFTTMLTVLWFGSALLFAGPITINWSSTDPPSAIWRLVAFINSALDQSTLVLLALLPLPLLWTTPLALSHKTTSAVVYTLLTAVIASASARTYFLHTTAPPATLPHLCSAIELALAITAASLTTLPLLFSPRPRKPLSTSTTPSPAHYPPHTPPSPATVIHRPSTPSLRFHDTESNLTFDMASPAHTRPPTLRSHSRCASGASQSSYAYTGTSVSVPVSPRRSPRGSRGVSLGELEARTRLLGTGRPGAGEIGVAVTTLGRGEGEGEEMQMLARLFADRGREWGGEGKEGVAGDVDRGRGG